MHHFGAAIVPGMEDAAGNSQTLDEWFGEREHLSVKRNLTNLATVLAPVLVGPIGSMAQSMFAG